MGAERETSSGCGSPEQKRVKSKQGEGVVDRLGVKEKVDWPAASHVLIKRLTRKNNAYAP